MQDIMENKNRFKSGFVIRKYYDDPNGLPAFEMYLENGGLNNAKQLCLFLVYYDQDFTPRLTTQQRDQQLLDRYNQGERISDLAREYGISPQRVFQIVKPKSSTNEN